MELKTELLVKGERKESIDSKVLEPQQDQFPIIKPYLKYKETQKEVSTYGYNWKNYINPITGRIHTSFTQILNTGRMSSGNKYENLPNIQNLPRGEDTRSCFISEPGNLLIDADYASQEQIVLANFSKEPNLLEFYHRGFQDMHSYVAFLMYKDIRKCTVEELTPEKLSYVKEEYPEQRRIAKSAGFAINPFLIIVALFRNKKINNRENCGKINGQSAAELSE
jgi:DNA polymerase-1